MYAWRCGRSTRDHISSPPALPRLLSHQTSPHSPIKPPIATPFPSHPHDGTQKFPHTHPQKRQTTREDLPAPSVPLRHQALPRPLRRPQELPERLLQHPVPELHVPAGHGAKHQAVPLVQRLEPQPVLGVQRALAQGGDDGAVGVREVDLGEPAALLGDDGGVGVEQDHDEGAQGGEARRVRRVLDRALVVDVGEEGRVREVGGVGARVAGGVGPVVLGGDDAGLHGGAPGVAGEQGARGAAREVPGAAAALEGRDAVVLAAEREQRVDAQRRAALQQAAQELAALAEAEGVDVELGVVRGGRVGAEGREEGIVQQVVADLGDLRAHVAEEGGRAVVVAGVAELDDVHVRAGMYALDQFADILKTWVVELVAETVPDEEGKGFGGFVVERWI
nr:hypothetical protein CFP56_16906 [Quercus suber]